MWINIILVVLALGGVIGLAILSADRLNPIIVVSLVVTSVVFILVLIGVLFCVALILLAVDIGRNLRAIRKNTRR